MPGIGLLYCPIHSLWFIVERVLEIPRCAFYARIFLALLPSDPLMCLYSVYHFPAKNIAEKEPRHLVGAV